MTNSRDYAEIGTLHIEGTGLLEVAEDNGIIMVFPQAKTTSFNKEACFDNFGYTGKNFANRHGKQVRIIQRMIKVFRN